MKRIRILSIIILMMPCLMNSELKAQNSWVKHPENPILVPGIPGEWDSILGSRVMVLHDGKEYKMYYCGWTGDHYDRWKIGLATSTDGVHWVKYSGNPVMSPTPGSWDQNEIYSPWVIFDGTIYKMWYSGANYYTGPIHIGYATSSDGINWVKHPTPVLYAGEPGDWDTWRIQDPCVEVSIDEYKMWYDAHPGFGEPYKIGYATSPDGIHWTKYQQNPVLEPDDLDAWDGTLVGMPSVIQDSQGYKMFYWGHNKLLGISAIGYAKSVDGINWTKYEGNPVLSKGSPEDWDGWTMGIPYVIFDGLTYKMWYIGVDISRKVAFGYAYSQGILAANINIDPDTLNLKSKGKWITVYIELPEEYDVFDIDISTVMLHYNDDSLDVAWGDIQGKTLMVKFDRESIKEMLNDVLGYVELKVTGAVAGTKFEGSDIIRIKSE